MGELGWRSLDACEMAHWAAAVLGAGPEEAALMRLPSLGGPYPWGGCQRLEVRQEAPGWGAG